LLPGQLETWLAVRKARDLIKRLTADSYRPDKDANFQDSYRCRSRGRLSGQLDADQEAAFRTTSDMIERLAVRTRDMIKRLTVRTARDLIKMPAFRTARGRSRGRLSKQLKPDPEAGFHYS
jgi:hypothetical protein